MQAHLRTPRCRTQTTLLVVSLVTTLSAIESSNRCVRFILDSLEENLPIKYTILRSAPSSMQTKNLMQVY